jgi:signal transduction histidine kinase
MLGYIRKSLSKKFLLVMMASVALIMLGVVYLTYSFGTEEMLRSMDISNEETAAAIYAGIKYPMSVGDSGAVQRELLAINEIVKDIDIYICDSRGTIKFSTDKSAVKAALDSHIPNKAAVSALQKALRSGDAPVSGFTEEEAGKNYLIHIHAILNEEECFRCHDRGKKVLGAIVSRKATDRNYAAIANIRDSLLMISIVGIFAIIAITQALLVRLVSQPLKALLKDIKRLPEQISKGDFVSGSAVTREDQIGALQNAFGDMAVEIYEKSHAIEMSNTKLEQAYLELESFAYSVSHDLRAPLRNIDGFSKILLDEYAPTLDDRAKHYLMRVRNGTERMSLLIDDMLAFSRIGRAELQFKRINCAEIIKPVLDYYAAESEKRKVSVILQDLPDINGDPVLMQSLFANFISNAFKYSRNTEQPEIVIGYDRGRKAIFVKDNGVGFEMKYHDKVFQVFQRLHLPEEYEGTGIGLAIVKRIAERHHGRVWAESEPGKGATFYIDLPIFKEV